MPSRLCSDAAGITLAGRAIPPYAFFAELSGCCCRHHPVAGRRYGITLRSEQEDHAGRSGEGAEGAGGEGGAVMAQVQGGRGGVRVPLAAARPPFYSFSNTILPLCDAGCRLFPHVALPFSCRSPARPYSCPLGICCAACRVVAPHYRVIAS